jgi:hypothetical protein
LDNVNPDDDVNTDGFLNAGLNPQVMPVLNTKDNNSSPEKASDKLVSNKPFRKRREPADLNHLHPPSNANNENSNFNEELSQHHHHPPAAKISPMPLPDTEEINNVASGQAGMVSQSEDEKSAAGQPVRRRRGRMVSKDRQPKPDSENKNKPEPLPEENVMWTKDLDYRYSLLPIPLRLRLSGTPLAGSQMDGS